MGTVAAAAVFLSAASGEELPGKAPLEKGAAKLSESGNSGRFFFHSYSTTTWTFLSELTSTIPYTCYVTDVAPDNNNACEGRRIRRSSKFVSDGLANPVLYSSGGSAKELEEGEQEDPLEKEDDTDGASEKLLFTVWRTSSTTVTATTFSTNRSVTVSISAMCTYPGIALNFC